MFSQERCFTLTIFLWIEFLLVGYLSFIVRFTIMYFNLIPVTNDKETKNLDTASLLIWVLIFVLTTTVCLLALVMTFKRSQAWLERNKARERNGLADNSLEDHEEEDDGAGIEISKLDSIGDSTSTHVVMV